MTPPRYNISDLTWRMDFVRPSTDEEADAAMAAVRRNATDDDELHLFTSMLFGGES